MFEKVSQVAEKAAANVSRRQFLGRFGRTAAGAAAALGGILALSGVAEGKRPTPALCNIASGSFCIGHHVGDPCGGKGKCTVFDGTDNECYCKERGRGGGRPGRGGR